MHHQQTDQIFALVPQRRHPGEVIVHLALAERGQRQELAAAIGLVGRTLDQAVRDETVDIAQRRRLEHLSGKARGLDRAELAAARGCI